MALVRAVLLVALVALAAGCALTEDSEDHEAGAAVKTLLEKEYFGDYGGAWDRLHPRHQRLVTREEYDECRRGIDVQGTIESVVVLDVEDSPLTGVRAPAEHAGEAGPGAGRDGRERIHRRLPRRPGRGRVALGAHRPGGARVRTHGLPRINSLLKPREGLHG